MAFVIAVLVLVAISFVSLKLRAYMCFFMVIAGISALIAGPARGESMFTYGGAASLAGGILILFLSSFKVERSRRLIYMLHLFLYGMVMMLRLMMIMTIILIPFVGFAGAICTHWHEVLVVDEMGRSTGKRVMVEDHGFGDDGNRYEKYDDPF